MSMRHLQLSVPSLSMAQFWLGVTLGIYWAAPATLSIPRSISQDAARGGHPPPPEMLLPRCKKQFLFLSLVDIKSHRNFTEITRNKRAGSEGWESRTS